MWSLVFGFVILLSCNHEELLFPNTDLNSRSSNEITDIRGVSYVATRNPIEASNMSPLKSIHANYVAVIPFALGTWDSPSLRFNENNQWWGETEEGVKTTIQLARDQGQKIMIKPQVWFRGGFYTGYFELKNEQDWTEFENNYSKYILMFARIAEETNTELFCIGTEFEKFVNERPVYWNELIVEVRKIYKGKLTYAGNWDSYKKLSLWVNLDFIGVDAYFPLTKEKYVTEDSIRSGWKRWIDEMESVSNKFKKQIVLTEIGYRSIEFAGKEPWLSSGGQTLNLENQKLLYQVMFEEVWSRPFIEGGFLWKWFPDQINSGGEDHLGFTPQNKPAQSELKHQFWNYSKRK